MKYLLYGPLNCFLREGLFGRFLQGFDGRGAQHSSRFQKWTRCHPLNFVGITLVIFATKLVTSGGRGSKTLSQEAIKGATLKYLHPRDDSSEQGSGARLNHLHTCGLLFVKYLLSCAFFLSASVTFAQGVLCYNATGFETIGITGDVLRMIDSEDSTYFSLKIVNRLVGTPTKGVAARFSGLVFFRVEDNDNPVLQRVAFAVNTDPSADEVKDENILAYGTFHTPPTGEFFLNLQFKNANQSLNFDCQWQRFGLHSERL